MKAIINKETNVVAYLFGDDAQVTITDKSMYAGGMRALDITDASHFVADTPANELFFGGLWTWTPGDGWVCIDDQALIAALYPSIYAQVAQAIQERLDTAAQACGYDNIHTACGWAGRIDDATALADWGAACWAVSKHISADILAGVLPVMTAEQVMAEMPVFGGGGILIRADQ